MKELANISAFTSLMNQECCSVTNRESVSPGKFHNLVTRSGWGKAALVSLLLSGILGSGVVGMRYMNTHKGAGDNIPGGKALQETVDGVNARLGVTPTHKYDDAQRQASDMGNQYYATQQQLDDANQTISQLQQELRAKEATLRGGRFMNNTQRSLLEQDIAALKRKISALEGSLESANADLHQANEDRDYLLQSTITKPEFDPDQDLPPSWFVGGDED